MWGWDCLGAGHAASAPCLARMLPWLLLAALPPSLSPADA